MVARWLPQLQTRHLHRLWTSGRVLLPASLFGSLLLSLAPVPIPGSVTMAEGGALISKSLGQMPPYIRGGAPPRARRLRMGGSRSHTILSRRTHGYQTPEQHMSSVPEHLQRPPASLSSIRYLQSTKCCSTGIQIVTSGPNEERWRSSIY